MSPLAYDIYAQRIRDARTVTHFGKVTQVVGLILESAGPAVSVGRLCHIENFDTGAKIRAEVVGFRDNRLLLMPLGPISGITPGAIVTSTSEQLRISVGPELIGRVIGGLGEPIDDKGPLLTQTTRPVNNEPIPALKRRPITEALRTGIRAVDITAAVGKGQRMGIFSGSGVGKSVMLGAMARGSSADVNVVALVGERGREVREFLERDLGEEGMKRSVVVAVTSDQPSLIRVKGALVATTIAEYFRDQGQDVMLLMDSLTRIAMAQREIGIAAGEPPTSKGYTPSVFSLLPKLLERAGNAARGSITGLYTVLVEGDDFNEPISDAVRSILDGHVTLSRKLASRNQYPAVDILDSISRLMIDVCTKEQLSLAGQLRELVAIYRDAEDLINIGAYVKGSNPKIDRAIAKIEEINAFLRQDIDETAPYEESLQRLQAVLEVSPVSTVSR
ncbi:MAG TPA: flagellar protein export ATPase FliI [Candidatus Deferrimicrobium sp.]|nr:flagellar protein export ATPase FliI [Candidatus Deferrimicrobium sp.]